MTDRVKGLLVALEEDVREDDAEAITGAIRQIRGVAAVEPSVTTPDDWINRQQVRAELRAKLWEALK